MPRKNQGTRPHVVILGAGFGGIKAAKLLADKDVDVTIVDKHISFIPPAIISSIDIYFI